MFNEIIQFSNKYSEVIQNKELLQYSMSPVQVEELLHNIEQNPQSYIDSNELGIWQLIFKEYAVSLCSNITECIRCTQQRIIKGKQIIKKERKLFQKANDPKMWKIFEENINMKRFDNIYCNYCSLSNYNIELERNIYDEFQYAVKSKLL